eukprot:9982398-Alexandrium_andersonii.AAC.1
MAKECSEKGPVTKRAKGSSGTGKPQAKAKKPQPWAGQLLTFEKAKVFLPDPSFKLYFDRHNRRLQCYNKIFGSRSAALT